MAKSLIQAPEKKKAAVCGLCFVRIGSFGFNCIEHINDSVQPSDFDLGYKVADTAKLFF